MVQRVLLTGASGFIGDRLHDPLRRAGASVRCLSRHPERAAARRPDLTWVAGDVQDADAMERALEGCDAAYYLVHGMGDLRRGWVERELAAARTFAAAAARAGVGRIVYLGGVAPAGTPSEHLRARLETGEVLRAGRVPCLELRAAMIVGAGSASWTIVRDLAARLPAMILPAWLSHRSEPVAVGDVVDALVAGLRVPLPASEAWDLPGPEALSGVEILRRVAEVMGRRPLLVRIPLVSPGLSSHWIRLVTRADHQLAAQLVAGLTSDLIARRPGFWSAAGLPPPRPLEVAVRLALAEEIGGLRLRSQALELVAAALTRRT